MLLEFMPNGSVGDCLIIVLWKSKRNSDVYGERYNDNPGILLPEYIFPWLAQLGEALVYCHEKEIIHGNVKPTK